ncbi:ArsR/SmtB family transcription factor [Cellulomonas carbonis]|uniref:ArsR family transcriptional regulator n=1 Tax=Cellulomonas carbonis T26 TaxID=947969 RepID=A0A0A0BMN6_9CELL|nr:helix-turn-helix domain-containing protein [Cellulomonas carbonis]KGM08982.1 ArsR family transcriptional regulator [Cellulomonas carbonis T26]GGC04063.1 hypothetical protein GCM10010972_16500 [Cellulomonas carbonis]
MVERKRSEPTNDDETARPGDGAPGPAVGAATPDEDPSASRSLGPSALKAYAHPLRMQIIRYLNDHGPATATTLAEALGESTGQTSYHVRQLARHGLVVDVPERNRGRERWWRSASVQVDAATLVAEDPALEGAARVLLSTVVRDRSEALARWLTRERIPPAWGRSLHSESTLHLTPDELAEMNDAFMAAMEPWTRLSAERREDPAWEGQPLVRVYYDAFPLLDD